MSSNKMSSPAAKAQRDGKKESPLKSTRRIGAEDSATRTSLLVATERLILDEGYAAVTTRRVAKQVGLTPALVHYYFPKTDDLLVAVFRRATDRTIARLTDALAAADPLLALWNFNIDPPVTTLAVEFMALANHRKVIANEIALSAERVRKIQSEALAKLAGPAGLDFCPPMVLAMLMVGLSRILVAEGALGISAGHAEARAYIESLLPRREQFSEPKPRPKTRRQRA
jgi:AcrR family transcriptional regulator